MPGMIAPPGPAYGDTISGTNLAGGRDRRSGSRPAPEGGHVVATLFRFGPRGAESEKGGYDMTAFWCRAGRSFPACRRA
ncbi:hypothetical protein MAHJHV60_46990 [Mycobacterium avium subsp. hominissuis]